MGDFNGSKAVYRPVKSRKPGLSTAGQLQSGKLFWNASSSSATAAKIRGRKRCTVVSSPSQALVCSPGLEAGLGERHQGSKSHSGATGWRSSPEYSPGHIQAAPAGQGGGVHHRLHSGKVVCHARCHKDGEGGNACPLQTGARWPMPWPSCTGIKRG